MHHRYRRTYIVKANNDEQQDKISPERTVISEEEEKEMTECGEKRAFSCLYNTLLHLIF